MTGWVVIGVAAAAVIARCVWLYRASLTWPTANGVVTQLEVERRQDSNGHHFCATFSYDFYDTNGSRVSGTWFKNFSSENDAREFAGRELPVGKQVVVRYSPKNPALNNLELDSWTYTDDRPISLKI
jgi:Protein of unknown function (DUF3592)